MIKLQVVHTTLNRRINDQDPVSNIVHVLKGSDDPSDAISQSHIDEAVRVLKEHHGDNLRSVFNLTSKKYEYKAKSLDRKALQENKVTNPPTVYDETLELR